MTIADALQFKATQYSGQQPGTRLIVTGAVHGNETCGTKAITRVMQELDSGALTIHNGCVTFVPIANPLAYAKGERSGERNLNRNLFPNPNPQDFEDRVANWLCPLLARHDVLLDLHSFNAASEPFVMVGPRDNDGPLEPFQHEQQERAMARRLGVRRFVDGWLRTYGAGVQRRLRDDSQLETVLRYGMGTTEYMRSTGGYALTLECGQHADPQAPEVGYRAILNTLAFLGLVDAPSPPPIADQAMEALSMVAVYDKQHANDRFTRPWSSFDPVRQGEQIGTRADGTPVLAEFDGRILFPDAAAGANSEWYYLTRANPGF
ncbi:succinylglutamate desuccinylase [Rugamonas sp. FT107W]|uniref:Succinylglutamate desuccinylase n=1 Tax=Duganella vulcania TaxID=2692166 RepID=A0A845HQ11_9BURK|nr:succinylglutamate desuccinylase/aspartoacylase family protein [Duganella vulcania]MYN18516.1 succinylglutamate desuccinylase [Duganella vulcania]